MGKLFTQLKQYNASDYYPYHMPGHKRRAWGELPPELAGMDITEIDGFDNLHQAEGILQELQEKAARIYGADETFYLVNGSTCGILSALSAALPEGGHLLMARNSHKSAYHAAYLRNLQVSYLYPNPYREYEIVDAITPDQVFRALEEAEKVDRPVQAVFLVSPTYEGRIADVATIAAIAHKKGIPLIVDEAHGAHLGMAHGFCENSCRLGADIVIHSVHKTLPAMTQTALLHVNGDLINRELLRRFLHIYQSSSPSYLLMGSIDNALELVATQGDRIFADFRSRYLTMLHRLETCRYLQFVPFEEGRQDIGKLVISSRNSDLSGKDIYDMLLSEYHLQLEMAAGSYCLAMFTVGDGPEAYERMVQALLAIDAGICDKQKAVSVDSSGSEILQVQPADSLIQGDLYMPVILQEKCSKDIGQKATLSLKDAWNRECQLVPFGEVAIGKIVGEFINLYPPGVPLLVPGEILTKEQYQLLRCYLGMGLTVQGLIGGNT